MQIANPIYDVVFKFMMEDNKVAKLFIGAILGLEIIELEFLPQEKSYHLDALTNGELLLYHLPTILRMDFSAKIKYENGEIKLILIELQKAKYYLEIMRFRRYLGEQYANPHNKIEEFYKDEKGIHVHIQGLPIFPIYILGEKVTMEKIPVIKVGREYIDVSNGQKLNIKHDFIEGLTHDAVFIQIPHLKEKRRTELEQLLYIFDQSNITETHKHFLEIDENAYPEKYKAVIRRLKMAIETQKVREQMKTEDEILSVFRILEMEAEMNKSALEEEKKKVEEKKLIIEEQKKKVEDIVKKLNASKMPIEQISQITNLSIEEIMDILKD